MLNLIFTFPGGLFLGILLGAVVGAVWASKHHQAADKLSADLAAARDLAQADAKKL